MAGAFTHFLISDEAKNSPAILDKKLWKLLNKHYRFLFLGSVSPDLPYLSIKADGVNWADIMHYEKTNAIVIEGHQEIKSKWSKNAVAEEIKLVWMMGYVSHLVADATIHPVVEMIVGKYEENKSDHRICEMTQDSIVYKDIRKSDIRYSEFSSMVKFCKESKQYDQVADFWKRLLLKIYPEKGGSPNPDLWTTTYGEAIDAVEGGSALIALFRHIGPAESYIYRTKEEIQSKYAQDYEDYYMKIKLPGGGTGTFKDNAFNKAVNNVAYAWKQLYQGLTNEFTVAQLIKNWNLDTGMEIGTNQRTYWG